MREIIVGGLHDDDAPQKIGYHMAFGGDKSNRDHKSDQSIA